MAFGEPEHERPSILHVENFISGDRASQKKCEVTSIAAQALT